jgi:hypothetical protein
MWLITPAALFSVFFPNIGAQDMIQEFFENLKVNRWIIIQLILMVRGMLLMMLCL